MTRRTRRTTRLVAGTAALCAALATAACGGGGGDDAAADGPVELTFWTWAPEIEGVVDLWNEQNPDIQVVVNKQDGGDPAVAKLLTAIRGGSGAPDVMQAEYQKVATLVAADALADLSETAAADVEDHFAEGVWSSVTLGGDALYAVPQDSGPMLFFYRADLFEELGLEVPATWDEYADVAREVRESDPDRFLGTFSATDAGWFTGLAQQAGASWWGIDGESWSVDIDEEPTQRVADYWGGLVEEGAIDNTPMYTPEWNQALNNGNQIGWLSAVWAPGVLAGNAGDTAGSWQVAPMPQWDESAPATGNWGGSATGVTTQSEHPEQAAEFATWLNTDPEAVAALAETGLYPADQESASEALASAPEFFSNQPDFYDVVAAAADTVNPFLYGPDVNVTYSAYNDEFAKAAQARDAAGFGAAVARMQQLTVEDMEGAGFEVAE